MDTEPTTAQTLQQTLQQAIQAHKTGKLKDAEALYRSILEAQPQHPDANHNLGVLAVSLSQAEAALPLFKTALDANPSQGQFWLSYIDALIKTNQLESAKSVLDQGKKAGLAGERLDALEAQLKPPALNQESAPPSQKQGLTSAQQVKMALAKKDKQKRSPSKQINSYPASSPSQSDIDLLLSHYQKNNSDLAENLAKTLTQKYPDHPFAWKVLGAVCKQTGRVQEALFPTQKAADLSLTDPEAHNNLGVMLKELGRLEEAEVSYRKAITLKPDYAQAHNNLGNILRALGSLKAAMTSLRKAIALKPDYAEAYSNLGLTLKELGSLEEAETSYYEALALKPDFKMANNGLGHILLKKNYHKEGLDRIRLGSGSVYFDVINGLTIK